MVLRIEVLAMPVCHLKSRVVQVTLGLVDIPGVVQCKKQDPSQGRSQQQRSKLSDQSSGNCGSAGGPSCAKD